MKIEACVVRLGPGMPHNERLNERGQYHIFDNYVGLGKWVHKQMEEAPADGRTLIELIKLAP